MTQKEIETVRGICVSNPEEREFKKQDGDAYKVRQHRIEIDVLTKRVDSMKKEIAELRKGYETHLLNEHGCEKKGKQ